MNTIRVTVMPGDGIGPEVMDATLQVLTATGLPFEWDYQVLGDKGPRDKRGRLTIPEATLASFMSNGLGLKGPTATTTHKSLNLQFRQWGKLGINVRPAWPMPGTQTLFAHLPINWRIYRENVEGFYASTERVVRKGVVKMTSTFTEEACCDLLAYAFADARRLGRKKVTVAHKDTIFKKSHGLLSALAKEYAAKYPDLVFESMLIDAFGMRLVSNPTDFDCIVLLNYEGDIFSDIAAGLTNGNLGAAGGANVGNGRFLGEAVHGTAPDIIGKGVANPTALIHSGAMLADHIGEVATGDRIRAAVMQTLRDGVHTGDIDKRNAVGTKAFTQAVIDHM